jgi:hypothetical protein
MEIVENKTGVRCRVCEGEIIETVTQVFNQMYGPPIDGPGSKQQWSEKKEYHCGQCGIVYKFLPK